MSEEILRCFDENGKDIDPQPRTEVLKEPRRWWCGAGDTFVVNQNREILCSQRASKVQGGPGKWQTVFGGHVKVGKTFKETAQEELIEESGINASIDDLYFVSRFAYEPQKYFHEYYLYIYTGDGSDIKLDPEEVSQSKWFSFEAYNQALANEPGSWTNTCSIENQEIIRKILDNSRNLL